MNDWQFDCICAGIVVADHLCEPVDHVPAPGELVLTRRMQLAIGGCASNVAVDLVRLGRTATVVGRVGRDAFGRFVRGSLEQTGVDCGQLAESTTAETSGTLVINTKGEDRRFIHCPGANAEFSGREVADDLIRKARVLYLGGYLLSETLSAPNVASIFEMARKAGVTTVLDVVIPGPGDYWPRLRSVLPVTDVFLPNNDEAGVITGSGDPEQQANQFRAAGAGTVVITCGGEGAFLVSSDSKLRARSYAIEFLDGTGSGDAFDAGFIYGLLKGCEPAGCLRYGSALGASCVRSAGATSGVFTEQQLEEFIASHELTIEEL